MNLDSLWGDDFTLPSNENKTKKILDKISKPKEIQVVKEKAIKSKKISVEEKLSIVKDEIYRVLGKQLDNVEVIYSRERFHEYIDTAIYNKIIAVDTETNNSLDPLTCKLMGLCLYTPNLKAAYIPVNHINKDSGEKLLQLTEEDIYQELSRLTSDVKVIMHNGKFDYQVIKCTCNVCLNIDWDTMIGAKLLDENGLKGDYSLKKLYIKHIDSEQEKYDIENLFEHLEYAIVDPELFALYAATDALMTYKLYEYQLSEFTKPESKALYNCALLLEMPMVKVIGEMELTGMEVDQEYTDLLSKKFHKRLDDVDTKINIELSELKPRIDAWRLTDDANYKPILGRAKKVNGISYKYMAASGGSGDMPYWYEAVTGRQLSSSEASSLGLTATEQKSKSEQLTDPINLASPIQLAILFYDVLKAPVVDKKQPRATGEDALKAIADKLHLKICDLILDRRELVKLLTTYIDVIPELAKR